VSGHGHVTPDTDGTKASLEAAVAELYEDAGLPVPIILERTDPAHSYAWMLPGDSFTIRDGGVEITSVSRTADSGSLHEPACIRQLAARIAEMAEQAEREPDPAEVKELAAIIREAPGWNVFPGTEKLAGHILRQWREREITP
jgi:hypothetical protein